MVIVQNHERSGHARRVLEFGGTVIETNIDWLRIGGSVHYIPSQKLQHLQTGAIVALGGIQADYLLSQKILDNLVLRKQKIDPITSVGYIFSAADQPRYNYLSSENMYGHDLASYVEMMEVMYGDKSMSLDSLKYHGLLSLLDSMLIASLYSTFNW